MVLFVLRLMHTAVFALCLTCLGLIAHYDLTGRGLVPALWALLPPALVGLGLLLNRGECILQSWARQLTGSGEAWARDVFFLPESWALRTVPVMLPLSLVLIAAIPVRYLFG